MTAHGLHPQCWPAYSPCPTRMQLITGLGEEDVNKRAMAGGKQGGRERSLAKSCFFFDIKTWGLFFPSHGTSPKQREVTQKRQREPYWCQIQKCNANTGLHLSKAVNAQEHPIGQNGSVPQAHNAIRGREHEQRSAYEILHTNNHNVYQTGMGRLPQLRH